MRFVNRYNPRVIPRTASCANGAALLNMTQLKKTCHVPKGALKVYFLGPSNHTNRQLIHRKWGMLICNTICDPGFANHFILVDQMSHGISKSPMKFRPNGPIDT